MRTQNMTFCHHDATTPEKHVEDVEEEEWDEKLGWNIRV